MKPVCLGKKSCRQQGIKPQTKLTLFGRWLCSKSGQGVEWGIRPLGRHCHQCPTCHPGQTHTCCQYWGPLVKSGSLFRVELLDGVVSMWTGRNRDARGDTLGWVRVARSPIWKAIWTFRLFSLVSLACVCMKLIQSCVILWSGVTLCASARFLYPCDSSLGWGAMPSSRGSSRPRDWTQVSYIFCIGRWVVYH